ncbi:hypothetical protein GCM10023217_31580 [Gordonia alkaliphila]|uniref:Lipoprotein n=1 Tax=Gordonia alkaliphila TaxID=1053547 RepID=A0ABP8ZIP5_9ACTN
MVGAIAALALFAGCASDGGGQTGEPVKVLLIGNNDSLVNKHEGKERCRYYDGDVKTGDRMTISGPNGDTLGVAQLEPHPDFRKSLSEPDTAIGVCYWYAKFDSIPVTEGAYAVQLEDYGSVTVSPEELRRDPLAIKVRNSFAALSGDDVLEVRQPD